MECAFFPIAVIMLQFLMELTENFSSFKILQEINSQRKIKLQSFDYLTKDDRNFEIALVKFRLI